jgi:hypothetical protein
MLSHVVEFRPNVKSTAQSDLYPLIQSPMVPRLFEPRRNLTLRSVTKFCEQGMLDKRRAHFL